MYQCATFSLQTPGKRMNAHDQDAGSTGDVVKHIGYIRIPIYQIPHARLPVISVTFPTRTVYGVKQQAKARGF